MMRLLRISLHLNFYFKKLISNLFQLRVFKVSLKSFHHIQNSEQITRKPTQLKSAPEIAEKTSQIVK